MGVGRRLREILPYSHGDAQKHGHESVNNSDAQKPSIDIRHIPAFPFTNRDSAEFNLARCSPLNVSLPRSISSLAAVSLPPPLILGSRQPRAACRPQLPHALRRAEWPLPG